MADFDPAVYHTSIVVRVSPAKLKLRTPKGDGSNGACSTNPPSLC